MKTFGLKFLAFLSTSMILSSCGVFDPFRGTVFDSRPQDHRKFFSWNTSPAGHQGTPGAEEQGLNATQSSRVVVEYTSEPTQGLLGLTGAIEAAQVASQTNYNVFELLQIINSAWAASGATWNGSRLLQLAGKNASLNAVAQKLERVNVHREGALTKFELISSAKNKTLVVYAHKNSPTACSFINEFFSISGSTPKSPFGDKPCSQAALSKFTTYSFLSSKNAAPEMGLLIAHDRSRSWAMGIKKPDGLDSNLKDFFGL